MNLGKIIGIVSLVLVVGGIGLLATKTYNPSWNPFRPNPKTVIEKVGKNLKDIETFNSKVDLSLAGEQQNQAINLAIDYKYDGRSEEKAKMDGNLDIGFDTEGMEVSGKADFITIGRDYYLKITTLPAALAPYLQMMALTPDSVKGEWIKISTSTAPTAEETEKQDIKDFENKVKDSFKDLFIVKKEYNDKKINGKDCYHYLVELNAEKAKELSAEFLNEMNPQKNITKADIEEELDQMKGITGEVWIGKKDYRIYKIMTDTKINDQQTAEEVNLKLEITFSDFNKEFEISAPDGYTTLKKLMQEQQGSLLEQQLQQMEGTQQLPEGSQQLPEGTQVPSQEYQYQY